MIAVAPQASITFARGFDTRDGGANEALRTEAVKQARLADTSRR